MMAKESIEFEINAFDYIVTPNESENANLSDYERRVYNAAGTLYINGKKVFSLSKLSCVMTGYRRSKPSAKQLQKIEETLLKLKDANLLEIKIESKISKNKKEFKKIHMVKEPVLLKHCFKDEKIVTVPIEYMELQNVNFTDKVLAFQDYLLMEMINSKRESKVLYTEMYQNLKIKKVSGSKELARDRNTIKKILNEWREKELIADFAEIKRGCQFIGITIAW